eukprot:GHVS01099741.1.p1 GENE.GHVS01099741.1~~GHVS01099741.1.p1  ORF type:complete len:407 (+),score=59.15 GHVS01099741.1:214-1434(+)
MNVSMPSSAALSFSHISSAPSSSSSSLNPSDGCFAPVSATPSTSPGSRHDSLDEGGGGRGGERKTDEVGFEGGGLGSKAGQKVSQACRGDGCRLPGFLYHAKTAPATFYGSTEWQPTETSARSTSSSPGFLSYSKGFNWISKFFRHSTKSSANSWQEIAGEEGAVTEDDFCSVVVDKGGQRDRHEEGGDGGDDTTLETCPILGYSRCTGDGIMFSGTGGTGSSSGRSVGSRFSVLSVSVPNSISFSLLVALFYSFMPYIILNAALVLMLLCSTAIAYSLIYMLSMWFLVAFLSEGVLKNILKHPRPVHSSVPSFGMPSGHSATCIAALAWWLLELRGPDGGPWGLFAEVSESARFGLACLFLIIFLPVPWGRYWLRDHSFSQCLVGGCLGVLCGVIGYVIRLSFFS